MNARYISGALAAICIGAIVPIVTVYLNFKYIEFANPWSWITVMIVCVVAIACSLVIYLFSVAGTK